MQPPVQPAVPVQPVPVQQPVGGVPVITPEQPPKKSNVGFIIIVLVLVIAIVGLVVAFFLNNNKGDDTKKDDVKTEEKQEKEEPVKEPEKEEPELNKPEEVANANKFKAGDYTLDVPNGFALYAYTNGMTILVDKTNKIEMRVLVLPNATVDLAINDKEEIKNELISAGATVSSDETAQIGNEKWLIFNIVNDSIPGVIGMGNIGTSDVVAVYVFSYATKAPKAVLTEVAPTFANAEKTGSSFADAKASYKVDSFKYFNKDLVS